MGRKRKGREISGWVILDKPAGPTSTALVNKLRWAFDAQKAGHAGTLDPAATGLLAVAFGEATKVVPLIADALKAYRFTIRLGQATDTDDAEGRVVAESPLRPDDAAIRAALAAYRGDILQVPPQYSAVRIEGERAYDLARDAQSFEIAPRPLFVESLELIERPDPDHAVLEMVCGKGGYVRSIARDLGRDLGCQAHVATLRRLWSGPFDLDQAVSPERIEALARTPELDALLLPLETGLADLPEARLSAEGAMRLRNGNPGQVIATEAAPGDLAWGSDRGQAVGFGTYMGGMLEPARVFVRGGAVP